MADFATCYAFVLPNEDFTPPRYETVPDPTKADPGALAISGINSAAFPKEFEDIFAIPVNQRASVVEAFYQAKFWNSRIAQLENAIAMRVIDAEVNHGDGTGVKLLQRACNVLSKLPMLTIDGLLGPLTVARANSENQVSLVLTFRDGRVSFLREAALTNPVVARDLPQLIARAQK